MQNLTPLSVSVPVFMLFWVLKIAPLEKQCEHGLSSVCRFIDPLSFNILPFNVGHYDFTSHSILNVLFR